MDSVGYPTEEEIERIKTWPFEDVDNALEFVASIWHWPDFAKRANGVLYLATGGWSGNEEIISAMQCNIGIWYRWICSSRGGAHEFELTKGYHDRETRFKLEQQLQAQAAALLHANEALSAQAAQLAAVERELDGLKQRLGEYATELNDYIAKSERLEEEIAGKNSNIAYYADQLQQAQATIARLDHEHDYDTKVTIPDLCSQLDQAQATIQRLTDIITWLLGENGEFPARPEGELPIRLYWWRKELRERFTKALAPAPGGQEERDRFYEAMHSMRGVYDPCESCNGSGVKVYGSTATWRGGIGGQAMTSAVCDQCWGSGDKYRHWANLRVMESELQAVKMKQAPAPADQPGGEG